MTHTDPDVRALRDALVPAIERDLARPRRRFTRRLAVPALIAGTVAAGTGVAAATGVIFAEPKVDPDVPAAAEWMFHDHDPTRPERTGGPVIMRPRAEAVARTNRATERALLARGVTARCGEDRAHYLACYLPDGDQVDATVQAEAMASLEGADNLEGAPANYEIRELSETEAREFLCAHPEQRREGFDATGC